MDTVIVTYKDKKLECHFHEDELIVEFIFFRGRHAGLNYTAKQLRVIEYLAIDKYLNR